MAILLYKQGIREFEKAVKLNIDPNGSLFIPSLLVHVYAPPIDNRATELHAKMRRNLAMARERVNVLRRSPSLVYSDNFLLSFSQKICSEKRMQRH